MKNITRSWVNATCISHAFVVSKQGKESEKYILKNLPSYDHRWLLTYLPAIFVNFPNYLKWASITFLFFFLFNFMSIGVLPACLSVWGCLISRNYSPRQLWAATWVLGLEPRFECLEQPALSTTESSLPPRKDCFPNMEILMRNIS